jgi:CRISPR system Cascade subunit CasC
MKLIELHILQSFPVSCLNRDDVGAPKTAVFGGATRARISSQCLKRAIRQCAKELLPELNRGVRTRYIIPLFEHALASHGVVKEKAQEMAKAVADFFNEVDKKDERRVKTAMFLSPREIDEMSMELATISEKKEPSAEDIRKACKKASRMDAADIALFGRMVANDSSVGVEAAAMFNHALSTHHVADDLDFFSAVDESKPADVPAGAAITDTLGFTSATYYRYAALNLSWLTDSNNFCSLAALSEDQRWAVVETFLRATLLAMPAARRNSMNADNPPAYVLGLYRELGQPVQLVNAFEKPLWSKNGYLQPSIRAMLMHYHRMKTVFGIVAGEEVGTGFEQAVEDVGKEGGLIAEMIPEHADIETFCRRLASHVK